MSTVLRATAKSRSKHMHWHVQRVLVFGCACQLFTLLQRQFYVPMVGSALLRLSAVRARVGGVDPNPMVA